MRVPDAIAQEAGPLVAEIDAGDVDALVQDVLPHVHLRPVADREGAEVLAGTLPTVVQVPQLGPLVLRVPLAELVAVAEDAFLGPGLLLIAPAAADGAVDLVALDGVQQGHGLQLVAAGMVAGLLLHLALVDALLHRAHDQLHTVLRHERIAEFDRLREVVAGVDVHQGEGHPGRVEGLAGQVEAHDRVLAAAEQQGRVVELGGHLAQDEDALALQLLQVGESVGMHGVSASPPRRKDRKGVPLLGEPLGVFAVISSLGLVLALFASSR